jgi:hypothetical protein
MLRFCFGKGMVKDRFRLLAIASIPRRPRSPCSTDGSHPMSLGELSLFGLGSMPYRELTIDNIQVDVQYFT